MAKAGAASPPEAVALPVRLAGDLAALDKELVEIDLLVAQATTEAERHEGRRAQAAEKLGKTVSGGSLDPTVLAEQYEQLLTLTQRAALMHSQVDVLEGKKRSLTRYRDALASYVETSTPEAAPAAGTEVEPEELDLGTMSPEIARLILDSQEDLRREIARAMHDGPAQSLTNIVLQAQIVERLVASDPGARGEVRELVAMVQQTLDATKSFIFDVRPMVLDDLGLVPTLRRAARDRGRRAGVAVEFESIGTDRRLPMELESGLFRILDEALTAYLAQTPDRLMLRLDWSSDRVEATARASRGITSPSVSEKGGASATEAPRKKGEELPPALAAMIADRLADEREAAEVARRGTIVSLPAGTWRELEIRAATLGITAELSDDGSELRITTDLPGFEEPPPE